MIALAAVGRRDRRAALPRRRRRASRRRRIARFPPTPAAGDWKMGILADGIAAPHVAHRRRDRRGWLGDYADALRRRRRERFARPALRPARSAYLARSPATTRYADARCATAAALKIGDWGKPLALVGRTGFRLLGPARHAPPARRRHTRPRRSSSGRRAPAPPPPSRSRRSVLPRLRLD